MVKFSYALCIASVFALAASADEVQKASDAPQPMSPAESASKMRLPEGFRIELVASEPVIQEPSCIAFDELGRMFVTELHGYNVEGELDVAELNKTGKLDKQVRRLRWEFMGGEVAKKAKQLQYGKVKLLLDTDGDGQMDNSEVWADDLPAAYGVIAARGGIIVVAAPDIVFLADRDGDGKVDERETLFTGFHKREMERGINNPRWGLDNWIYVGAGGHGGTITGPHLKESVELQHSDFRIKADGSAIEPVTGRVGTFGLTMNDLGDRFPCSGGQPAIYALPMQYNELTRNPNIATPGTNHAAANYGRGFRISEPHPWRIRRRQDPAWIKFYGNRETDSNYFTGGCGGEIYNAALFPEEYHGSFYYCEPSLNIVHRCVLMRDGAGYEARRAPRDEASEFLASRDQWFRPMNLRVGPDGALYIVDMYREIIEDYSAIPRFLQQQYGLEKGRDKGRIWRLLPEDTRSSFKPLASAAVPELVTSLSSRNMETRLTAQRLLISRGVEDDKEHYESKIKLLHSAAQANPWAVGRIHAIYALQGLGELTNEDVAEALLADDYRLRLHGLRCLSRWATNEQPEAFAARFQNDSQLARAIRTMNYRDDPKVRLQWALTASQCPVQSDQPLAETFVEMANEFHGDRWLTSAMMTCDPSIQRDMLDIMLQGKTVAIKLVEPICSSLGRSESAPLRYGQLLTPLPERSEEAQIACLRGFVQGQRQTQNPKTLKETGWLVKLLTSPNLDVGRHAIELSSMWMPDHPELAKAYQQAAERASSENVLLRDRVAALNALRNAPGELLLKHAPKFITSRQPPELQTAAIEAIGGSGHAKAGEVLLANWDSHTPKMRNTILATMLSRRELLPTLISALEESRIRVQSLNDSQRSQLLNGTSDAIADRAKRVLKQVSSPDLQARIARYEAGLGQSRDLAAGGKLFASTCLNCHKLGDRGHEVGPSLGSAINKPDEAILVDILDPSSKIDSEYTSYVAVTQQGQSITGVLTSESPTSITLTLEKGTEATILRADIDLLKASEVSLMPSNLHEQINPKAMANLLAYMRTAYAK